MSNVPELQFENKNGMLHRISRPKKSVIRMNNQGETFLNTLNPNITPELVMNPHNTHLINSFDEIFNQIENQLKIERKILQVVKETDSNTKDNIKSQSEFSEGNTNPIQIQKNTYFDNYQKISSLSHTPTIGNVPKFTNDN